MNAEILKSMAEDNIEQAKQLIGIGHYSLASFHLQQAVDQLQQISSSMQDETPGIKTIDI